MPAPSELARKTLSDRLEGQAKLSERATPLYAHLLHKAAAELVAGETVWGVLSGFEDEPATSAVALRLMAAVHRLVLTDRLPELARHYPSVGGDGDAEAAWPLFLGALVDRRAEVHELVKASCQTNEVGRSAALLCGFLQVGHDTELPLRMLEIGSSAGLNLRWDHYRYEFEGAGWGDPASPVRMSGKSFKVPPPFDWNAVVAERSGCDINPIDINTNEGALTVRSFLWADQVDRFRLLDAAIEVARRVPAKIERKDAPHFLETELATSRPGLATVVFESVMWQYMTAETQDRVTAIINGAGKRATANEPLAWLRMEAGEERFEIRLQMWPGGVDRLLARSGPHGTNVRWLSG